MRKWGYTCTEHAHVHHHHSTGKPHATYELAQEAMLNVLENSEVSESKDDGVNTIHIADDAHDFDCEPKKSQEEIFASSTSVFPQFLDHTQQTLGKLFTFHLALLVQAVPVQIHIGRMVLKKGQSQVGDP